MGTTQIIFWALTAMCILGAIMVVSSKNPVHSVLWLIATFFAISGHYVLLNAQFLAIVNIIVYAGAIMVLFLFVIMLMNLNRPTHPLKNRTLQFVGVISGGCLLLVLIAALKNSEVSANIAQTGSGNIGLVKSLGRELFTNYVIPFEIASVLFLSAMVGAVVIGKKN